MGNYHHRAPLGNGILVLFFMQMVFSNCECIRAPDDVCEILDFLLSPVGCLCYIFESISSFMMVLFVREICVLCDRSDVRSPMMEA